VSKGD